MTYFGVMDVDQEVLEMSADEHAPRLPTDFAIFAHFARSAQVAESRDFAGHARFSHHEISLDRVILPSPSGIVSLRSSHRSRYR